jgi:hypothetical protein
MQVTLKKASGLALALSAISVACPTGLNFSIYDNPDHLESRLKDAEVQRDVALKRAADVISATYTIRLLIGEANAGAISALVTERAMIDKQLAMLNAIKIVENLPDVGAILRRVDALKEAPKTSSYSQPADTLAISLENWSVITPQLKHWKKRKIAVDDELAKLNYVTLITLPDDVVKVLRDHDLI